MQTKITLTLFAITALAYGEINLGEIEVISTNKTNHSALNTTSNIEVVTSDEIAQYGYLSIGDILSNQLGITLSQNGGLGQKSSLFLRGMDSGKVLILIDGMRLNDPSTTNNMAMIEFLPISNVESIEIMRGGSSSIWGANASAGVINIITKKETKKGVSGNIGINGGSHKTYGSDISLFYSDTKLNAKLMGSFLNTNGISALAPHNSEKDNYKNKNLTAGIGYDFTDTTKANINIIKTKTKGNFDDEYNLDLADDAYSNFITDSTNIAGVFSTKIGAIDTTANLAHGRYKRQYLTTSPWFGSGDNRYEATTNEYSLTNSYAHKHGKSVLGLEYKRIDGFNQYNTFDPTDGSYKNKGIFLSNSINPIDKLLIEANLRYDDFDKFSGKTTYKLGAKYTILDHFIVKMNIFSSFNAPSVYQLANPIFGEILKPSYVNGYDIGLSYKDFITLGYFRNKIKNDIIYDYANWGYYNNDATEKIRGIEISAKTPMFADSFVLRANYTHLIDTKDSSNTPLYHRAKDELNSWIEYFYDANTIVSLNGQYIGDRLSLNDAKTGNYSLWNLHVTKKYNDNIDISIHIKNLLNKEYQSVSGYNQYKRNFSTTLNYKF